MNRNLSVAMCSQETHIHVFISVSGNTGHHMFKY